MKPDKRGTTTEEPPTRPSAVASYVADLQRRYGAYARPADETRRLVDASMGEARLTDVLYESRKD